MIKEFKIFEKNKTFVNLTLSQFKSLYKGLVEKSKEKILKSILEKHRLYVAGIENYVKLPK